MLLLYDGNDEECACAVFLCMQYKWVKRLPPFLSMPSMFSAAEMMFLVIGKSLIIIFSDISLIR